MNVAGIPVTARQLISDALVAVVLLVALIAFTALAVAVVPQ